MGTSDGSESGVSGETGISAHGDGSGSNHEDEGACHCDVLGVGTRYETS
jgi:hypothetical protein